MRDQTRTVAVLGPTNTGKTHYAIERMLAHRTGVIGLPLRLLAREVYDRIVAQRGPSVVALVTGEERIVPDRARYWVCTVEAMPQEIGADFVAVDEIQLCADLERGHVFTDRLLRARGLHETMFLGSDTMRGAIAALVPGTTFLHRERFSELSYNGSRKISRMPTRSAIVGFSVENVYANAELIRRQKGGCAVVTGGLSPRTRNAQVALYQNGDVDYLVATDAIGMGLNLDIGHVAFSALAKFDGHRMRPLFPHEMGQIAGRAGRHTQPGSFGVTGEARPLPEDLVDAIENHRFAPIRKLQWRNSDLSFGSVERLIASLETGTTNEWLTRAREADDLAALRHLAAMPEVADLVRGTAGVRLLWDVCRIPDFRGISSTEHAGLLARIHGFLQAEGRVPDDWLARNVKRIDRTDGDIDALSKRLAHIRTWTYVAQRSGWVTDENHWRGETRAVEDRLSDALHMRLTQRFVDRRTSVLLRRLKQKESLVAEVNDKGEVTVEGEFVGRLEGFRFHQDATSGPDEARTLRSAGLQALKPEFHLRADRFYNAPDTELDFTEQGGLMWGSSAVGKLVAGADPMRPQVEPFVDEEAGPDVVEKVRRRLQHFVDRKVATQFEPLLALSKDEALTGLARGFAFRLVEALGVLPRDQVADEVKQLDQEARGALRKHGIRFGQYTIFLPALLKPAPTRLRLVLWSLANGLQEFPESPPPGLVTIPNIVEVPKQHYTLAGYRPAGKRAIRIDMLERLADLLRAKDWRAGFEATPEMLSITGMTLEQFSDLMEGLGFKAERGERPKVRAEQAAKEAALREMPVGLAEDVEAVASGADAVFDATGAEADLDDARVPVEAVDGLEPGQPVRTPAFPDEEPGDPADETGSDMAPEVTSDDALGAIPVSDEALRSLAVEDGVEPPVEPVESEVFYTFVWAPRPRHNRNAPRGGEGRSRSRNERQGSDRPAGEQRAAGENRGERREGQSQGQPHGQPRGERRNKPEGGKPDHGKRQKFEGKEGRHGGKGKEKRSEQPRSFESRPPRNDRIDPDSPFAILAALKERK
ncbi:helicase [Haematobacter missouriensis]|uniref:Helicase n=1 Tax=Haematobacter missouriensis TaxID=366616 RepID=A0A212AWR6_9RHOB|nr:helicase-related protein [Haematobacter missouriensis]KFI33933.1 helicase [Haematobacter missouriensis]OWJ71297.1 helicase [Haematobacter missouriensis]OWJ85927.1 helicase [Haematobacter missouriensis]